MVDEAGKGTSFDREHGRHMRRQCVSRKRQKFWLTVLLLVAVARPLGWTGGVCASHPGHHGAHDRSLHRRAHHEKSTAWLGGFPVDMLEVDDPGDTDGQYPGVSTLGAFCAGATSAVTLRIAAAGAVRSRADARARHRRGSHAGVRAGGHAGAVPGQDRPAHLPRGGGRLGLAAIRHAPRFADGTGAHPTVPRRSPAGRQRPRALSPMGRLHRRGRQVERGVRKPVQPERTVGGAASADRVRRGGDRGATETSQSGSGGRVARRARVSALASPLGAAEHIGVRRGAGAGDHQPESGQVGCIGYGCAGGRAAAALHRHPVADGRRRGERRSGGAVLGNCWRKLVYYSGHDTTLFDLRAALGVPAVIDGIAPYLSHVIFELRRVGPEDDAFQVTVLAGHYAQRPRPLRGPFCGGHATCAASQFMAWVNDTVPGDVTTACAAESESWLGRLFGVHRPTPSAAPHAVRGQEGDGTAADARDDASGRRGLLQGLLLCSLILLVPVAFLALRGWRRQPMRDAYEPI
eukprot:ctg_387.g186